MKRIYGQPVGDTLDNIRYMQAHFESEKEIIQNLYNTNVINKIVYEWAIETINKSEIETWFI